MKTLSATGLGLAWALAVVVGLAAPVPQERKPGPTPPDELIREALDRTVTLDIDGQPLHLAIKQLGEQSGVNIVLDRVAVQLLSLDPERVQVNFKGKDVKLRTALDSILDEHNLRIAVVGDVVLLTTERAMSQRMQQRVNIDFKNTDFAAAIKQLARDTTTCLTLDPRAAKEVKGTVSLRLENVTLETALRVMSEMVGLKAVAVGTGMVFCSRATPVTDIRGDTGEIAKALRTQTRLLARRHFKGFDDPKTTLEEALRQLSGALDITMRINEKAFKVENVMDVGKTPIADPNAIAEFTGTLSEMLGKILAKVPASPSGATFIIRRDTIEITTAEAVFEEFYHDRTADVSPPPLVHASFQEVPLNVALRDLARMYGGNLIVDGRAAREAGTSVTADFSNVPLDTAVTLLADMCGLKVVHAEKVLYVTTKKNARALQQEEERRRLKSLEKPVGPKSLEKPVDVK
jgi:hypothetical protein